MEMVVLIVNTATAISHDNYPDTGLSSNSITVAC